MLAGSMASQQSNSSDDAALIAAWAAVEAYLNRWTKEHMDRAALLPTFRYYGDDAVKALRCVIGARARTQLVRQSWQEVPVSPYSAGTLITDDNFGTSSHRAFIDHSKLRSLKGTTRSATAYFGMASTKWSKAASMSSRTQRLRRCRSRFR